MSNGQNNVVVDEQMAQNLQQVKDTEKATGKTETLANGDSQEVNGEKKTNENDQKIEKDNKIEVGIRDKEKGKEKDKFETISIVKQRKVVESNIVKVGAAQCAVMGASALVGLSNPIGLMICVAIAFKKLTASTKDIEFKQDAGKIKNINDKKNEINKVVIDIVDDEKMIDEIGKLFSKEEQEKCAETGKVEISEDKAKKLSKILNCNVKAGTLDFNDEKSLNDVLEARTVKNIEFMKALTSILNPKINESTKQMSILSEKMNENIQKTPTPSKKVVVGKGQGRTPQY